MDSMEVSAEGTVVATSGSDGEDKTSLAASSSTGVKETVGILAVTDEVGGKAVVPVEKVEGQGGAVSDGLEGASSSSESTVKSAKIFNTKRKEKKTESGDGDDGSSDLSESLDDEEIFNEGKKWMNVRDLRKLNLAEARVVLKEDKTDLSTPHKKRNHPIRKVIVRRLPPDITIQSYLEQIPEMPKYIKIRLVTMHESFPSRIGYRSTICITFVNENEAIWFKEKYNGVVFYDEGGYDYISCVDFSLIQEVPEDLPPWPGKGTLEQTDDYKQFLEQFEQNPWAFTMKELEDIKTPDEMLQEILNKAKQGAEETPLLKFLRRRGEKEETRRKERDQRRKERDAERRRLKEESSKRKKKEKEEAAKKKSKEKEDAVKREKEKQREKKRERDRERNKERDRERRNRREKAKQAAAQEETAEGNSAAPIQAEGSKSVENEKDIKSKGKPFPGGSVTYSRSGNPTRWSENSGPRKNEKRGDNKKSNDAKPGESKGQKPGEKQRVDKREDITSTKSPFGKPFPMKETETKPADKIAADKDKSKEIGNGDAKTEEKPSTSSANPNSENLASKKKVVRRIIRVKKVREEGGSNETGDTPANPNAANELKPKKVVRVVRKTSKEDGSASSSNANSKPPAGDAEGKKEERGGNGGNRGGGGDTKKDSQQQEGKGENEKERKNRKGRPEIQIYRPGSLRGGANSGNKSSGGGSKNPNSNAAGASKDSGNNDA